MKRIVEGDKFVKGKRGGWRPGGGRPKGSQNLVNVKMNKEVAKQMNAAKKDGRELMAIDVVQRVYRGPNVDPAVRLRCAQIALPYESHRLSATELSGPEGGAIEHRFTNIDQELERKLAKGVRPGGS